jgi:hypothetical protein
MLPLVPASSRRPPRTTRPCRKPTCHSAKFFTPVVFLMKSALQSFTGMDMAVRPAVVTVSIRIPDSAGTNFLPFFP